MGFLSVPLVIASVIAVAIAVVVAVLFLVVVGTLVVLVVVAVALFVLVAVLLVMGVPDRTLLRKQRALRRRSRWQDSSFWTS